MRMESGGGRRSPKTWRKFLRAGMREASWTAASSAAFHQGSNYFLRARNASRRGNMGNAPYFRAARQENPARRSERRISAREKSWMRCTSSLRRQREPCWRNTVIARVKRRCDRCSEISESTTQSRPPRQFRDWAGRPSNRTTSKINIPPGRNARATIAKKLSSDRTRRPGDR